MTDREIWQVNEVELTVKAIGHGPLVVLAHGFPDLGITWRLQVDTLVEAGYRVLVPDLRGYGNSSRPAARAAYTASAIGLDLIALLDHEGVAQAHIVGHDWGAASVWPLGMTHGDRLLSLTGISVPYVRPASAPPMSMVRSRLGDDFYQVRFQDESAAARLQQDVRHTIAAAYSEHFHSMGNSKDLAQAPDWLPRPIFDRYVATFSDTGFEGGLAYYRNIDDNWREAIALGDRPITCPSLFITGSADPVTEFMRVEAGASAFTDLRTVVIDGAGHWVHQEAPVEVNRALLEHLERASRQHDERSPGQRASPAPPSPAHR